MSTLRLSIYIEAKERAAFSRLLDQAVDLEHVRSWGEKVHKSGTDFHVTFINEHDIWTIALAWAEIKAKL